MRRRWIYPQHGEPFEVGDDYVPVRRHVLDCSLWNDRAYQDCADPRFASRSQHRAYMRENGLTTADDYAGEWDAARRAREAFFDHAPDPTRTQDIARAIGMLEAGHRPRRQEEL